MPYIVGNATPNKVWYSFPLPDDPQFIGAFVGAIQVMSNEWMWSDPYGTATIEQAIEYAEYAYENRIRSMPAELVTGVRVTGTNIEIRDANGVWQDAGELCVNCNDTSPELLPEANDLDNLCAAVTQTVDWLSAQQLELLNQWQAWKSGTQTVWKAFEVFVEGMTMGAGELIPIDEFVSFWFLATQASMDIVRNTQQGVTFLEEAKEWLYCRIKSDGQPYALTETIFNEWCSEFDNIPPLPTIAFEIGHIARETIGYGITLNRFKLYSADVENDCELSYNCSSGDCHVFDFVNMPSLPSEFSFAGGHGTYLQGFGIKLTLQSNGTDYNGRANITITGAPAGSVLDDIRVYLTHEGVVSLVYMTSLNLWSDGQVDTPQTYDPNGDVLDFTPTIEIAPPDFTIPVLFQHGTSQEVTNYVYTVRSLRICGNATLINWLQSIDTLV